MRAAVQTAQVTAPVSLCPPMNGQYSWYRIKGAIMRVNLIHEYKVARDQPHASRAMIITICFC